MANTKKGRKFEKRVKLHIIKYLKRKGYKTDNKNKNKECYVFKKKGREITIYLKGFNKRFLKPKRIDMNRILPKRIIPDIAIVKKRRLFIIEIKDQKQAGSVDEKLQSCDFKKKQYEKIMSFSLSKYDVAYVYVLGDWFYNRRNEYRDILKYIKDMGCNYLFFHNAGSLKRLGLP
jgi:hypothetical protein